MESEVEADRDFERKLALTPLREDNEKGLITRHCEEVSEVLCLGPFCCSSFGCDFARRGSASS